jgi:4-oxalocrotonate tautomerase
MPFVNVKVAGNLNTEQKKQITKGITDLLADVAGKPASSTYILIEEHERENWCVGGKLLSE